LSEKGPRIGLACGGGGGKSLLSRKSGEDARRISLSGEKKADTLTPRGKRFWEKKGASVHTPFGATGKKKKKGGKRKAAGSSLWRASEREKKKKRTTTSPF